MKYSGRLEITTRIGCSCNCVYCPQSLLINKYFSREKGNMAEKVMSFDTFTKCVDKLRKGTRIDFSGMAEPWLNKDCTKMVLYAHEKGFPIAIYTTLVGMTDEDFDAIKDIPVEEFVLHIPDDKSNAHIKITDEYIKLLEKAIHYRNKDGLELVTGYSCHAGIHPEIVDAIPSDSKLINEINNRAGNIDDEYVENKKNTGHIVCVNCEADIHHNVLLPDGTLLLCCMDYGMKHILGNLLEQDYDALHESEEAKKIINGFKDDTIDTLCRNCVNARTINELYDDYMVFVNWNKQLVQNEKRSIKELNDYKDWVGNLQNQIEEMKTQEVRVEKRYDDRLSELHDYQNWVGNLEKQIQEMKDENSALQKQIQEMKDENCILEKQYNDIRNDCINIRFRNRAKKN